MNRRRFLELAAISSAFIAGCSGGPEDTPNEQTTTQIATNTATPVPVTESATQTETPTESPTPTPEDAAFDLRRVRYPKSVTKDESFEVKADIRNLGGQTARTTVSIEIGNVSLSKEVEVEPDSTRTLTFSFDDSTGLPDVGRLEILLEETATDDVLQGLELKIQEKHPDTIFVAPDGSDQNDGSKDRPLETIQRALDLAQPGQTVFVNAGRYEESLVTRRDGTPDQPITLTGPPDAVVTGDRDQEFGDGCMIRHSHFHIRGLTFDGLKRPSEPDDPMSYMLRAVTCIPKQPQYSRGIVIKPHAVGRARGSLIDLNYVENIEVGEFQVTGPGGLKWLLTDREDHWGEIVYVGQSPPVSLNIIDFHDELSEAGLDLSNNIYIHHIDNSAGHEHSEIVNTKLGTHDVLVEYCTDSGGSQNTETYPAASVRLQSYDATVRWCDLKNGRGHGVQVASWKARDRREAKSESELIEAEKRGGKDNAIYGNQVEGFDDLAFSFPNSNSGQTPEAQKYFCGNEFDGETDGNPEKSCSKEVPEGDGIGHLGGDSPWS